MENTRTAFWTVIANYADGVTTWVADPMPREAADEHADEMIQREDIVSVAVEPVQGAISWDGNGGTHGESLVA